MTFKNETYSMLPENPTRIRHEYLLVTQAYFQRGATAFLQKLNFIQHE